MSGIISSGLSSSAKCPVSRSRKKPEQWGERQVGAVVDEQVIPDILLVRRVEQSLIMVPVVEADGLRGACDDIYQQKNNLL